MPIAIVSRTAQKIREIFPQYLKMINQLSKEMA